MVAWHPDSSADRGKAEADQNRGFNPVGDVCEMGKVNKSLGGLKIIPLFCNIAAQTLFVRFIMEEILLGLLSNDIYVLFFSGKRFYVGLLHVIG